MDSGQRSSFPPFGCSAAVVHHRRPRDPGRSNDPGSRRAAKGLASVGCAVAGFSQFAMQLQDQPPVRNDRQNQEQ